MSYLSREFRKLAGRAVHRYRMIEPGDRVLVGLSGGKDSLALLEFLSERRRRVPVEYSLVAVHLDLGYDDQAQAAALAAYVRSLGLEGHFEKTGFARAAQVASARENPCFICSRLRRRRLFELARDYGCSKVALGHHRDDLIETLLLNIFFSGEISTMRPKLSLFQGLFTLIRPLFLVPEEKITRLVRARGLPVMDNACPSAGQSKRREIKALVAGLARKNDKIKGNVFRALSNYRPEYLLEPELAARRGAGG